MSIFGKIPHVKSNVRRNGFDLSHKCMFNASMGMLIPIMCKEVVPSDHFKISVQSLTRTMPLNTAAFARINENFDFFFVPYRRLWSGFDDWVVQANNDVNFYRDQIGNKIPLTSRSATSPIGLNWQVLADGVAHCMNTSASSFTPGNKLFVSNSQTKDLYKDDMNIPVVWGARRLLDMLGYGNIRVTPSSVLDDAYNDESGDAVTLFALHAYQKIYQDFYRNPYWESEDVTLSTSEYYDSVFNQSLTSHNFGLSEVQNIPWLRKLLTIRYSDYKKDMLMGIKPMQQLGDVTAIPLRSGNFGSASSYVDILQQMVSNSKSLFNYDQTTDVQDGSTLGNRSLDVVSLNNGILKPESLGNMPFVSLLDMRVAYSLQRWKEVSLTNRMDYKHQMKAHLNANIPDGRADQVEYIGGHTNALQIGEVVNTSDGDQGRITGKGISYSNNDGITYDVKEHGLIMCIYHIQPEIDYSAFRLERMHTKFHPLDYLNPEFQNIGLAPMYVRDFSTLSDGDFSTPYPTSLTQKVLGFQTRFPEYKGSLDETHGELSENGSLKSWCIPWNYSVLSGWTVAGSTNGFDYRAFKVSPNADSNIFAHVANGDEQLDHYYSNCYFNIYAVRPLDVDGMPY